MLTEPFLLVTYAAMIAIGVSIGRRIEQRKTANLIDGIREDSFEHGRRIERQFWDIPAR